MWQCIAFQKEGIKAGLFANSRFSPLFLKREGPGVSLSLIKNNPQVPLKTQGFVKNLILTFRQS